MSTDEPIKEYVSFLCGHCNVHSRSEVIVSAQYYEEIEHAPGRTHLGPDYRYRLVRCSACYDLSLLIAMRVGAVDDKDYYEDDTAVYPAAPRHMSPAVPEKLQKCFFEARVCYKARAYTASAIMCRRALELLAAERGVREPNLAKSLKKLKDSGDIDQRLYDWCDELRLAGNEAVHDVDSNVSQADARDMSDLAEAIIDYVFVFQARYVQFKNRRGRQQR